MTNLTRSESSKYNAQSSYTCKSCDYNTDKLGNFKKHLMTQKHLRLNQGTESSISNQMKGFICHACGVIYRHKPSLSKHRKKCDAVLAKQRLTDEQYKELTRKADLYDKRKGEMAEMKEVLDSAIQSAARGSTPSIINNNFNVNIILETHCADALSITEFANKLQLTLEDLVYTQTNGYIEGVSNVFIKGLQELDPTQRPIQCSDKKGKDIYVKDNNNWEKDEGKVLDSHISLVSKKQVDILRVWEEEHPNWKNCELETKTYMELVSEVMGGSSNEERSKNHKLIQQKIGLNCSLSDVINS